MISTRREHAMCQGLGPWISLDDMNDWLGRSAPDRAAIAPHAMRSDGLSERARRLARCLGDILQHRSDPASAVEFDLEALLHDQIIAQMPLFSVQNMRLRLDYDPGLPSGFHGDQPWLHKLIGNILSDLRHHSAADTLLCRVVGQELAADRHQLNISFEDDGPALDTATLDQIFASAMRRGSTSGQAIRLGPGGTMNPGQENIAWLQSDPVRGNSIGFRLTLATTATASVFAPPLRGGKVLLAEETFSARIILARHLQLSGTEVLPCRSSAEVLERMCSGACPDLVLLSESLPGQDGISLAQNLRATGVKTPILLLSDCPEAAEERWGAAALTAILQRPVSRAAITACLRRYLPAPPPLLLTQPLPQKPAKAAVLIVEPNLTTRLLLEKLLVSLDLNLRFAASETEGIAWLNQQTPRLLMMSLALPGAWQAVRDIRLAEAAERRLRLPIIALSDAGQLPSPEALQAAGFDLGLGKPLQRSVLCAAVTGCLSPRRLAEVKKPDAA